MATVERFKNIEVMKYNNIEGVDILIRDSRGDEILLMHEEVIFLHKILSKWIGEIEESYANRDVQEDNHRWSGILEDL